MADVVQKVVYGDPHSQWNKTIISEYIPPKNEPTGRCGHQGVNQVQNYQGWETESKLFEKVCQDWRNLISPISK